ncbi:MAG: acyl--CoA ligase [Proteobacteria bacterium]|nr:acyl--CoA ligase [Pseudomonadota bacterium]
MEFNPDQTIPQAFEQTADRFPNKTAVVYLGTAFTYARLEDLVHRFAAGLRAVGVEPGARVMMYIPNGVQWIIAWLGIIRAGAVAVPVTPVYTVRDLEFLAGDTEAQAIVCTDRNFGYVTRARQTTPLKTAIVSSLADMLPAWKRFLGWAMDKVPRGSFRSDDHTLSLRALLAKGAGGPPPLTADPGDMAEILYTGGTTKHPKGVPIGHRLYLRAAHEQIVTSRHLVPPEDNVVLAGAPLFHILGQACELATLICTGGTLIVLPRVNLDALMDAVTRYRATTLVAVPALYRMILEHDRTDEYDLSSLKYCFSAGDVLPEEVGLRWEKRFGPNLYQWYGATETCGGVVMAPTDVRIPIRSMGRFAQTREVRIVDPSTLAPVEPGNPGELLVHGPADMVTAYWNQPEETAKSFVEIDSKIFYRTADIVSVDPEGNVYFVDRTVDTIKHKGYRISASEIEAVLQEHPAVIGSCVVGVPDPKVGERIKAFVVLKSDVRGVTGYDLIKFCHGKLVNYKIPAYIEFRDMLPKSKVGKMLRREVRQEEKKRLEQT